MRAIAERDSHLGTRRLLRYSRARNREVSATAIPLQLENQVRAAYEKIPRESRATMGGCIAALPDADELQDYLAQLRAAWLSGWCNQPGRYQHLLLRLYHCIAFLRYQGNAF